MSIIYGPVPSWRLGRSLGIDLLPGRGKTCCFDCIYCQLGITTQRQVERGHFVLLSTLSEELAAARGVAADCVTFSGTGEPTLAENLGRAIEMARKGLGLPVAVLTNSALMIRKDVRDDLSKADLVVAKLDAPNERLLRLINRPAPGLSFQQIVDGLKSFRSQWKGRLAIQMMFLSANERDAGEMAAIVAGLAPDEVQINTPLRPCAIAPLSPEEIEAICGSFAGLNVHNVYEAKRPEVEPINVRETQRRRPGGRP